MKDVQDAHPFEKPSKSDWFKDIEKYLKYGVTKDNLRIVDNEVKLDPFYTRADVTTGESLSKSLDDIKPVKILSSSDGIMKTLAAGFQGVILPESETQENQLGSVNRDIVDIISYGANASGLDGVKNYSKYIKCTDDVMASLKQGIAVSQSLLIEFNPSEDFYANLAHLRAMNKVLLDVAADFKVVSVIETSENEIGDKGLIEATYKVLASILGSADYIAFKTDDPEVERLYLNIFWIMKYESGLLDVNDPVAGSYFIEEYTQQLINSF